MVQEYCWVCGEKLSEKMSKTDGIAPYCPRCDRFRYPMYNTAVSMIVRDRDTGDILLIKQYGRPYFILVAGYVNRSESLEDAARRELREETGLNAVSVHFNRSRFFEPSNTLMCNFTVSVDNAADIAPNSEIDFYQWFSQEDARCNIKENSLAQFFLNSYLG